MNSAYGRFSLKIRSRPTSWSERIAQAPRGGLSLGERAPLRRARAPRGCTTCSYGHRRHTLNAAWEANHREASVEVNVEGRLIKAWVTWFVTARPAEA